MTNMALASPQIHLRYMTLTSLGSNLGGTAEVGGVYEPRFRRTKERRTLASSKPKAKSSLALLHSLDLSTTFACDVSHKTQPVNKAKMVLLPFYK